MKRQEVDTNISVKVKKLKLSKAEKKVLEKERRKLRMFEIKKNSLIKDSYVDDCEYYFEGGLRKVIPYYYTFRTCVKLRWVGKRLVDVFSDEFYTGREQSLLHRINSGYLMVNDKICTADHRLTEQDIIVHKIHRHELPILDDPIKIIKEDEKILIINKPCSLPIHSVSKYHYNTVLGILAKSYGLPQLRVVHRIDRMTSGILIFAKNYEKSVELSLQIKDRLVSKYYLAIVKGNFISSSPIECNQPLGVLCPKLGLWYVQNLEDGGKESSTRFILLRYDDKSDTSLVLCKPNTGRTHQIRIHLQYLGHPIINDPLYNSDAWGPDIGKLALYHKPKEQLIQDLRSNHTISFHQSLETGSVDNTSPPGDVNKDTSDGLVGHYDPDCEDCVSKITYNIKPSSLVLYLHAFRYRSLSGDWDYHTELPSWTLPFQSQDSDLLSEVLFRTQSDCDLKI